MPLTITILQDGPKNTRIRVVGTALSAPTPYTVVANPATLSVADPSFQKNATALRIDKVDYDIMDGLEVVVYWGNTTPANADQIWAFTGRGMVDNRKYQDFNNSKVTGWDGTIAIAQPNSANVGTSDSFTIVLTLVKQYTENNV